MSHETGEAMVLPNPGSSNFKIDDLVTFPVGQKPRSILAIDLDGDGWQDLVIGHFDKPRNDDIRIITVHPGQGNLSFGAGREYQLEGWPGSIAAGDLETYCLII